MAKHPFQRWTQQREVILAELRKLTSHPTACDLYEIVRQRLPKVSLGTVYRNLELLADQGTVCKLELGGTEARFDGNVKRHDHIRCLECGRVDDAKSPPLELSRSTGHDLGGYRILGYRLEYVGVCPDCRRQSEPDPGVDARRAGAGPGPGAAG